MNKITILIAEDHKLIRETWAAVLETDERFEVIGAYGDTREAISFAQLKQPDIILMDINIFPLNGFQATAQLQETVPFSKVIALSFHTEMTFVEKMFASGARGYITKNSGCGELMESIICVHAGNKYICAEVREKGYDVAALSQKSRPAVYALTMKELEISHCMQNGLSTKDIAGKLNISVRTVGSHRHSIFKKLNVKSSVSMLSLLNAEPEYWKKPLLKFRGE